jgi:Arc/MetJ-type ribon-helix-helix transcriptional regulator
MTITLPEHTLLTAKAQAAAGGYASVDDYVRSLVEADTEKAATLAAIREGLAQADAGLGRPAGEAMVDIARRVGIKLEKTS